MSVKRVCPCDTDGFCPYEDMHSGYWGSCEYWCGADEPQDEPDVWEDEDPEVEPCKWSEDGECSLSCDCNKCNGSACERRECAYCDEDDFPDYTEWYEQQEAEHEEEYYRRKKG